MSIFNRFANLLSITNTSEEISKILPIAESSVSWNCNSSDCYNKFNENSFKLKGVASTESLYSTAKSSDLHILVATGKTDWPHDALDVPDTILATIQENSSKLNGSIKVNVSSEALNINDPDYITGKKCDLLLQPWFIRIRGVNFENVEIVFGKINEILNNDDKNNHNNTFDKLTEELENLNIVVEKDINNSYILLCSHKTRDKKCGITAPIMKKEFDSQLRDLDLFRDQSDDREGGVKVLFVNHVGGHKYAANVLIYKKNGEFVWFARCTPLNVKPILTETILKGKVFPDNIRTCKKFEAVNW